MNNQEKQAIQQFIAHMSVKDYAKAEKSLQNAVEEKLKEIIRKETASPNEEK